MAINYGIIGCGMMGREHLRNINLLQLLDMMVEDIGFQLVVVYNQVRLQYLMKEILYHLQVVLLR